MNGTPPRALRARADEDLALAQRNRRGGSPIPAETETRPEKSMGTRSLGTTMQPQAYLQVK